MIVSDKFAKTYYSVDTHPNEAIVKHTTNLKKKHMKGSMISYEDITLYKYIISITLKTNLSQRTRSN